MCVNPDLVNMGYQVSVLVSSVIMQLLENLLDKIEVY